MGFSKFEFRPIESYQYIRGVFGLEEYGQYFILRISRRWLISAETCSKQIGTA